MKTWWRNLRNLDKMQRLETRVTQLSARIDELESTHAMNKAAWTRRVEALIDLASKARAIGYEYAQKGWPLR